MTGDLVLFAARLLMAVPFVLGAIPKLMGEPGEKALMAKVGVPAAGAMQRLCGIALAVGAAMLVLGAGTRLAAILLAVFVVVVTPIFIQFWKIPDPQGRIKALQAFFTNVGLVGGLLALYAAGPGNWALFPQY